MTHHASTPAGAPSRRVLHSSIASGSKVRWLAVPLHVAPDEKAPPARVADLVRIESSEASDGTDQRVPIPTKDHARELARQLIAFPASAARLTELRGGNRLGLVEWTAAGLGASTIKVLVRARARGPSPAPASAPSRPAVSPSSLVKRAPPQPQHWIEIVVKDEEGAPMANVAYLIVTADKQRHSGTTNAQGVARLDGIVAGPCEVSLTNLDNEDWKKA